MTRTRIISAIIAAVACIALSGNALAAPSLTPDKSEYKPGETMTLTFQGISNPAPQDWISLYKVGAPNEKYGQWYYLGQVGSGSLTFTAPSEPGDYEFRLFLDWPAGGYVSVAQSDVVKVRGLRRKPSERNTQATLSLDADIYEPGQEIVVEFTAPTTFAKNAWIGIIPSGVQHGSETVNDQYDIAYQYIGGMGSGTFRFAVPANPGSYDMRMFDTDDGGMEAASASFEVEASSGGGSASLSLDADIYGPGQEIVVEFKAPAGLRNNAWIGIIPTDVPHGSEAENDSHDLTYRYLEGRTSGSLTFTAPPNEGSYDVRMFDTDDGGRELTFENFEVER